MKNVVQKNKSSRSLSGMRNASYPASLPEITEQNIRAKRSSFEAKKTNVKLGFIQPGKPTQNAFIESLNGKFRNEWLNQHGFRSLEEARSEIDQWRQHYNNVRLHSSLGCMPPVGFAKKAAPCL
jgi:putative transposase